MAERIKVYVRIRPAVQHRQDSIDSLDSSDDLLPNFEYDTKLNQFRLKNKIYTIDGILPPPSQQTDVYHAFATDQISAFLQGFNTTIFAYGQTGSGKTHTIFGPDMTQHTKPKSLVSTPSKLTFTPSNSDHTHSPNTSIPSNIQSLHGLVPRCFITVFETLQSSKHIKKHQVDLSCVEVYNTTLRDLFKPSNSQNLRIREDIKSKKFFVENLTEETVQSCSELMLFIKRIQINRAVSSTNMNQTSSRSHVLLQLRVIQQLLTGETKESLLTFVDLAGSEMVRKTGTEGDRLKEAGYINSSLSTLSRVIEGLGLQHSGKNKTGHSHIPFRDSSLTKLLKTALGGNCKTTLVVCVSSERQHREETHSSLRFATRAACIKNEPVINKALDAQALYEENIKLKAEIERLMTLNGGAQDEWFQAKLDELEAKEMEIVKLKGVIEELQLKLDKMRDGERDRRLSKVEEENMKLSQQMNEIEIELMRERHCKESMQERLVDLQVIHSEVASQRLFDDRPEIDVEIEAYRRCSSVDEPPDRDMTKKVILDAIKFRRKMKEVLSPNEGNEELRNMFLEYMPIEAKKDDTVDLNNIDPIYLMDVCKAMNDKIQILENALHGDGVQWEYGKYTINGLGNVIALNVTDVSFMEMGHCIASSYDTNVDDSPLSEYNDVQSNDMIDAEKYNLLSNKSYHIYKNDSGTEVSFEQLTLSEVLDDQDVDVIIARTEEIEEKKESVDDEQKLSDLVDNCHQETQTAVSFVNMETQTDAIEDEVEYASVTDVQADVIEEEVEYVPVADTSCSSSILQIFKWRS